MPSASYSFLDVVILDEVRERFAAGDALAILSTDLEQVIWANGPGAQLFGYPDIDAILGASPQLGFATRQISATSGFPAIGRDRAILVRMATGMTSRAVAFLASTVALPDGEMAILLAVPAATGGARSDKEIAERAIGGFGEAGHFVAFIDGRGAIEAASAGFSTLGLAPETLAGMVERVGGERGRIAKRMLAGAKGALPAGMARLTETRHLLVVIDEGRVGEDNLEAPSGAEEAGVAATDAVVPVAAEVAVDLREEEPALDDAGLPIEAAEAVGRQDAIPEPLARGEPTDSAEHDSWYFSAADDASQEGPASPARNAEAASGIDAPAESGAEASAPEIVELADAESSTGFGEPDDRQAEASSAREPAAVSEAGGREAALAEEAAIAPRIDRASAPVRFVWRTDADGKFSQISPEFARAVGAEAAGIVGRSFQDVANAFGLDPSGEIAGLLARRDTWSGRSVLWPIAGTDLKIPVDLAALPVYGRDRSFEGFRGFGVARAGDAMVDPEGLGLVLVKATGGAPEPVADGAAAEAPEAANDAQKPADPFQGEVPALSIVPMQERRFTDKVIRLAEHRQPANDKGLSTGERIAFQQIGERLKKDSGTPAAKAAGTKRPGKAAPEQADAGAATPEQAEGVTTGDPAAPVGTVDTTEAVLSDDPVETAGDSDDVSELLIIDGASGGEADISAEVRPVQGLSVAEQAALSSDAGAGDEAADAEAAAHTEAAALIDAAAKAEAEAAPDIQAGVSPIDVSPAAKPTQPGEGDEAPAVKSGAAEPAAELPGENRAAEPQAPATGRKPARPGMSLLDFAQWDQEDGPAAEAPAPGSAAEGESAAGETPGDAQTELRPTAAEQAQEIAETAAAPQEEPEPIETARPEPAGNEPNGEPAQVAGASDTDAATVWEATVVPAEPVAVADPDEAAAAGEPGAAEAVEPADEREAELAHVGPAVEAPSASETPPERPKPEAPPLRTGGLTPSALSSGDPAHRTSGAETAILEKLPVPVLVHSGDELHYANGEFLALTGYASVGDLSDAGGIGALFAEPYVDEDAPERSDRQLRLRTRNGEEFPVEAFLQSVPWNDGKALVLVVSRAKGGAFGAASASQSPLIAELEARVAEMRTIIDTATDGVVLISRDGTIRSISRPAEALFGFDSDEVTGKAFASLFAIESQRAARDYLNGLSDNGVASVLNDGREVIGREAQGRFIPLFMTIGKLPSDSGYCAVVRDITQWKRAEEELTQARAVAERASSHKTDFLARVSHEIRTPLNAIIGFSELMMDEKFGPVANDRYRDYLRDINRSGNHVLDLVNDLLDISKIEAGQQEMAYEAVSLNDTLAETVAMMQPQANRERVIIRSSFASKLPEVVADLRSVRQIGLNILSNAVRYTQAGGQVIVSTAYEVTGDIVMRVRDTGIGMTQAEIEQALKPFKQINSLKRARGDGTGLGLPLTKAMVEANRAKFTINSTPGEGTLVEVTFPSTRVLAD